MCCSTYSEWAKRSRGVGVRHALKCEMVCPRPSLIETCAAALCNKQVDTQICSTSLMLYPDSITELFLFIACSRCSLH